MKRLLEVVKEQLTTNTQPTLILAQLLKEERDVFPFLGLLTNEDEERFYQEHKEELTELYQEDPELVEEHLVFAAKRNILRHTMIKIGVEKILMIFEENLQECR